MNDDELLRELGAAARRADTRPTETPLDAPLGPAFEAAVAAKIHRRGRVVGLRWAWVAAPVAAAAAGVALWLSPARSVATGLPEYAMEVSGGVDEERGQALPGTDVAVRPGDVLTLVLRPSVDVVGPTEAHVFVAAGGTREVPVTIRSSPTGSLELHARATDLVAGGTGPVEAVVVVTRSGVGLDPKTLVSTTPVPPGARVIPLHVHVAR